MRKILFILICLPFIGYGQYKFSCEGVDSENWDPDTKKWNSLGNFDKNAASLFVVNEDETMIYHTTDKMKSVYYITENKNIDKENAVSYNTVSDAGNDYIFIFDYDFKEIKIINIFEDDPHDWYFIRWYVKSIF